MYLLPRKKTLVLNTILHLSIWFVIFIPSIIRNSHPHEGDIHHPPYLWGVNLLLLMSFYFNFFLITPLLFVRKRYLLYLGIMLGILGVISVLLFAYLTNQGHHHSRLHSLGFFYLFLLAWGVSTGLRFMQEWHSSQQKQAQIEAAYAQTELSLLKAQIHPHFLFNTLNSIYALALQHSDKTPESILKLAQIMRYSLQEAQKDKVFLAQELDFIQDFIALQQIRLTETTPIDFQILGEVDGIEIAPMLLIPFIENAFKYGVSNRKTTPIRICIEISSKELIFFCQNLRFSVPLQPEISGTRTGLVNVKRRLALIYPNRHRLEIEESEHYTVRLHILF